VNLFAEERAEAVLAALGIETGLRRGDIWRVREWLADCIVVRERDVACGFCQHARDGRGIITVPRGLYGPDLDELMEEETGHFLVTDGVASLFWDTADGEAFNRHLSGRWRMKEEALVRTFLGALYLPSRYFRYMTDTELAEVSGCSPRLVSERRDYLAGDIVLLNGAPDWSAWWRYEAVYRPSSFHPLVRIVAQDGAPEAFEVGCPPALRDDIERSIVADLCAMTANEFGHKYRRLCCPDDEPLRVQPGDLLQWSGVLP